MANSETPLSGKQVPNWNCPIRAFRILPISGAMESLNIYGLTVRGVNRNPETGDSGRVPEVIGIIEQQAIDIDAGATEALILGLRSLQQDIRVNGKFGSSGGDCLANLLTIHREKTVARHRQTEDDVRDILDLIGSAVETVGTQANEQHATLRQFAEDFHAVSRIRDIGEMRRSLLGRVSELRTAVENMWRASRNSVSDVESQLEQFQNRLEAAEKLAATDPLTGLLNRRETEARLAEKAARNEEFCLLLVDLDGFKQINDRNGHSAGDQVLRIFAKKLLNRCKRSETVCRWGGDEFVVLIDCTLASAEERVKAIVSEVNGSYTVYVMRQPVELTLTVSTGIAEHQTGEHPDDLFARADQAMYDRKKEEGAPVQTFTSE
jgi:diguanylate cyclase (GGDEF)-like protein